MAELFDENRFEEQIDSKIKTAIVNDFKQPETYKAEVLRKDSEGRWWVRFEGSDDETPVMVNKIDMRVGDVVTVTIKDHQSIADGNLTSPALSAANTYGYVDRVIADVIKASEAEIGYLKADVATIGYAQIQDADITNARIQNLVYEVTTNTNHLTAVDASILDLQTNSLTANSAVITSLQAQTAKVQNLTAEGLEASVAYIDDLSAGNITAGDIIADHAEVSDLDANYAHITDGVIDNAKIGHADVNGLNANYAHLANGVIDNAKIGYADVNGLNANYAHVSNGVIDNAKIGHADVNGLSANYAEIDMANVNNAWIQNGTVKNAAITNEMVQDISANKLTAGTINGSIINVTNLNADNITTGTINGQRIGTSSLSLDKLSEDVYTEAEVDSIVDGLNDRIDGAIETFTGTAVPTLQNTPASSWDTATLKDQHVGDVYYVVNSQSQQNGYCYRFTKSGTGSSATYSWQLIKDSDVTAALSRLQTAEGKIGTIEQFDATVSSFMTDTDEELSSLKSRTTTVETSVQTAQTTANGALVETVQLWFTKSNTTAPNKPTAHVTNTTTDSNVWTTKVPTYNASYPHYYYCYEYKKADGSYAWSTVVHDEAMCESQAMSRAAASDASSAVSTANQAATNASSAVSTANQAATDASSAVSTANSASSAASQAASDASSALSTANSASSTANQAASDASSAVTTANQASSTASAAQTAAATADGKAVAAQNTANKNVKESIQLWFTKANTTAPSKPTAAVTSTATTGNAWTTKVPVYNASYPYYFYCWQYKLADGTYAWSDVVEDKAMAEVQTTARTAASNASSALSQLTTKVEKSVFNELSQTVDENSATITTLGTVLTNNGLTSSTNISNTVNSVQQTANANSASITSLTTTIEKNYLKETSKGEQLVVNGSGLMGDNTNFSSWVYDPSVCMNGSAGSFTTAASEKVYRDWTIDEFIPVSANDQYILSYDIMSETSDSERPIFYSYVSMYDIDKQGIDYDKVHYVPGTMTTLSQELKAGDTEVHLANVDDSFVYANNQNGLSFWNYTNSKGHTYPVGTYTRNVYLRLISSQSQIDKTNDKINLSSAWTGPTYAAGTPVSMSQSGATYVHVAASNIRVPAEPTHKEGTLGPGFLDGDRSEGAPYKFREGTAYAKIGFLWNYQAKSNARIWLANLSFAKNVASQSELDSLTTTTTNKFNTIDQTLDGIETSIGNIEETVATKADGSTVTTLSSRVNTISDTVDGHTSQITQVTATANAMGSGVVDYSRMGVWEQGTTSNEAVGKTYAQLKANNTSRIRFVNEMPITPGEYQVTMASGFQWYAFTFGSDYKLIRMIGWNSSVDYKLTISDGEAYIVFLLRKGTGSSSIVPSEAGDSKLRLVYTYASDSEFQSVKTDYATFKQTVNEFNSTIGTTYATKTELSEASSGAEITKSASGERVIITEDAADLPLIDLTAYGESVQDGTPTPDAPVYIQAVRPSNAIPATFGSFDWWDVPSAGTGTQIKITVSAYGGFTFLDSFKIGGTVELDGLTLTKTTVKAYSTSASSMNCRLCFPSETTLHGVKTITVGAYFKVTGDNATGAISIIPRRTSGNIETYSATIQKGVWTFVAHTFTLDTDFVLTDVLLFAASNTSGSADSYIQIETAGFFFSLGSVSNQPFYTPSGHVAAIATGYNLLDPTQITLYGCSGSAADGAINVTSTAGSSSNGIKLGWFPPGTYTMNADSFGGTTDYKGTRLISNLQVASNWVYNQYFPNILNERSHDAYYRDGVTYPFTFTTSDWFYLAFCVSGAKDKTFTATNLRMVRGSVDRPYSSFTKDVSYIDLKGNELYGLNESYKDTLRIDADGNATIEKRCGKKKLSESINGGRYAAGVYWLKFPDVLGQDITSGSHSNTVPLLSDSFVHTTGSANTWTNGSVGDFTRHAVAAYPTYNHDVFFKVATDYSSAADFLVDYGDVEFVYPLDEPYWQTVSLGRVDLPTVQDDSTVHVAAEVQPVIDGSWWTKAGYSVGKLAQQTKTSQGSLEAPYTEVEWVESDGTQYVYLDWKPPIATWGFEADFIIRNAFNTTAGAWRSDTNTAGYGNVFGTRNVSSANDVQFGTYGTYGLLRNGTASYTTSGLLKIDKTRQQVSYRGTSLKRGDGSTVTWARSSETADKPYANMAVFAMHEGLRRSATGRVVQPGTVRIYSLKFYDGDELKVDLVGAVRNRDRMTGLYDKVKGHFYPAKGLLCGNEIGVLGEPDTISKALDRQNISVSIDNRLISRMWEAEVPTLDRLDDGQQITVVFSTGIGGSSPNAIVAAGYDDFTGWDEGAGTSYSSVYLKLTLSDGSNTGWIPCYYGQGTRLTSHYGSGVPVLMTYRENVLYNATTTSAGTAVMRAWYADPNYVDENTTYTKYSDAVIAGKNGLKPYTLCMKDDVGNWTTIVNQASTGSSDKTCYTGGLQLGAVTWHATNATYAAGANGGQLWESYGGIDFRRDVNGITDNANTTTLQLRKPVYLVGTLDDDDGLFYLDTTKWWTQDSFTTGKVYVLVGHAYSSYFAIFLAANNPSYIWNGTQLVEFSYSRIVQAETKIVQTDSSILSLAQANATWTAPDGTTQTNQTAAKLQLKANKDTLTSEINASADTVKISADRVNIEGAAIFTSGRLSSTSLNNAYDAKGAAATAKSEAISAAASDATSKANTAKSEAISAAASDATSKANTAKSEAIASAKNYTDAIEIGGRNLLYNSKNLTPLWNNPNATIVNGVATVTRPSSGSDCRIYQMPVDNAMGKWLSGKTYTMSVDAKRGTGSANLNLVPRGASSKVFTLTTEWARYSLTVTCSEDSTSSATFELNGGSAGDTILLRYPKVEYGTKPTDWTPAPEDLASASDSVEYIVGTQTGVTGSWTGVTKETSLVAGKTIAYKLPYAGSGNASLQLKDSSGNNVGGNIAVYSMTTRVTTHYPAGSIIQMTFDGTNWRTAGWYNTNNFDRKQIANAVRVAENYPQYVIGGYSGSGYKKIAANLEIDLSHPVAYLNQGNISQQTYAVASGGTTTNFFTAIPGVNVRTTNGVSNWTGTQYAPLYLKGTVNGNTFTVHSDMFTTTVPSSADNCVYMYVGLMYSTYQVYFDSSSDLYAYLDGKFRQVTPTEIVSSQRIYWRTDTVGIPTAPSSWVDEDDNVYKVWTTKVPPIAEGVDADASYPYLYTCEQRKRLDGSVNCTQVLLDENTTIIDGGSIITNSIAANRLDISDVITVGGFASKEDVEGLDRYVRGEYYVLTEDATVQAGKTYYTQVIDGDSIEYTVSSATVGSSASGLYELDSIASRIEGLGVKYDTVNDKYEDVAGLYDDLDSVINDDVNGVVAKLDQVSGDVDELSGGFSQLDSDFKSVLRLASDSVTLGQISNGAYAGCRAVLTSDSVDFVNSNGEIVSSYGQGAQIGRLAETHIESSGDYLLFMPANKTSKGKDMSDLAIRESVLNDAVAYIAVSPNPPYESVFYMTRSVVVKDMFLGEGKWKFYKRENNNLSLKWLGGM